MKKFFLSAITALSVIGVAMAADSTEFGVLYVPSSAKETVVAVPWLESGTGSQSVCVSNLVLTAGLAVGDQLMLYTSGTSYACWILTDEGGRHWEPGTTVSIAGVTAAAGADSATIDRGKAIILKRENPGAGFYIMGKPATLSAKEQTLPLPSGSSSAAAYALIAPPSATATTVGSLTWTNLKSMKDYLIVGSNFETLTYSKTKGWIKSDGKSATSVEIPAGQGVWFMSRGAGDGDKSVSWN